MECGLKRGKSNQVFYILTICFLLLAGAATTYFYTYFENSTIKIVLNNDGIISEIVTMETTVKGLLQKYSIVLEEGDIVKPEKESLLQEGSKVVVERAMEIFVSADGIEQSVFLIEGTVEDALSKSGIKLSSLDRLNHSLDTELSPGLVIMVTRVMQETVVTSEAIPYRVITRKDNSRDETHRRIYQQGRQGEFVREYKVTYQDGAEISREFVRDQVVQEPIDHIVIAGTLGRKITSRGENVRYAFSRVFEITAYTHTGNPTRTGVMPKVGHVAVDPRVIPLNSTIFIDFSGRWNHLDGFYKATDTGGVILGDIVDIFMDTEEEAIRFGRRRARVYLVR